MSSWPSWKTLQKSSEKTSSSLTHAAKAPVIQQVKQSNADASAENAKRKAGLKGKAAAAKRLPGQTGHILGGADYVSLMMGSRRRAKEEAAKLPKS